MDIEAYVPKEMWEELLRATCQTNESLNSRYDIILHLVTAAYGAEKYYSNETNTFRTETLEFAREIDLKTRNSWSNHPQRHIITNEYVSFEAKISAATEIIVSHLQKSSI